MHPRTTEHNSHSYSLQNSFAIYLGANQVKSTHSLHLNKSFIAATRNIHSRWLYCPVIHEIFLLVSSVVWVWTGAVHQFFQMKLSETPWPLQAYSNWRGSKSSKFMQLLNHCTLKLNDFNTWVINMIKHLCSRLTDIACLMLV